MKKLSFILILLIFSIKVTAYGYEEDGFKVFMNDKEYKLTVPDTWKVKNKDKVMEFYRDGKLMGGFSEKYIPKALESNKIEEISMVMGKATIYKEVHTEDDSILLVALISSKDKEAAMYLYSDKDNLQKDSFILKILLLNIDDA